MSLKGCTFDSLMVSIRENMWAGQRAKKGGITKTMIMTRKLDFLSKLCREADY